MASFTLTPSSAVLVQQTPVLISGSVYTPNTVFYVHIIEPGTAQATGMPYPRYSERQVVSDQSGAWSFTWLPMVTGTYTIKVFTYPTQFINTMNPDMEVVRSQPAINQGANQTVTVAG